MTELELLGPRAYGAPCGQAVLKAVAEDFQVNEVLDIAFSGQGEHLWLWVEKRELNTEEAARRLARAAGIGLKDISYAGLKDRHALTRQWFSLHLPGKADPDLRAAHSPELTVLKQHRHHRKLQRGAHAANGFLLRLTDLQADIPALNARLEHIKAAGVPNYFGPQRFGFEGGNVHEARHFAQQQSLPSQRNRRSRILSAGRSFLFNRVLAERVADGSWNQVLAGDLLAFTDSKSFFPEAQTTADDPRLSALDLHPTGPLWGEGDSPAGAEVGKLEQRVAQQQLSLAKWLAAADMRQERRTLRLPIGELAWHYPAPDILQLEFVLPAGCFATSVVREFLELAEQTETTCVF